MEFTTVKLYSGCDAECHGRIIYRRRGKRREGKRIRDGRGKERRRVRE